MRILYHHRTGSRDGQAVHIEELIAALRRRGHEVLVVGPPASAAKAFGSDAGMIALLKRRLPGAVYEGLELGYSLLSYIRLSSAARRFRPDALYERANLFNLAGWWLKRRLGLPLLLEVNAPLAEERSRHGGLALGGLGRWSETRVWRGADWVLPVTQVLAEMVVAAGVLRERVVVVPNGIDPRRFADAPATDAAKRRLGLEGRTVLGFVGFVREWHGVNEVIDLLAKADPGLGLHLLMVGDGPARPALEAQAARLGVADRVSFAGIIGRDQIPAYIAAFDIALQPAVVPYCSPLKLFEYMALARAIVAPDTPNIREVVEHGRSAWLFRPGDPGALGRAMEDLVGDPALRGRLGQGAQAAIEERGLTWDANAARVEELIGLSLSAGLPRPADRGAPAAEPASGRPPSA